MTNNTKNNYNNCRLILNCNVCNKEVERTRFFEKVTCFTCKRANMNTYYKAWYKSKKPKDKKPKGKVKILGEEFEVGKTLIAPENEKTREYIKAMKGNI